MERKDAELLINELAKHPRVIPFDKGIFIDELFLTEVKDSSRFYEGLPYREQSSRESMDCYYVLSLRRVLRNRNAGDNYHSLKNYGMKLHTV